MQDGVIIKNQELLDRCVQYLLKWKTAVYLFYRRNLEESSEDQSGLMRLATLVAALKRVKPGIRDFKQRCNTFPARLGFATGQE